VKSLSLYVSEYKQYLLISDVMGYFIIVITVGFYSVFVVFASRIERTLADVEVLYRYMPVNCERRIVKEIAGLIGELECVVESTGGGGGNMNMGMGIGRKMTYVPVTTSLELKENGNTTAAGATTVKGDRQKRRFYLKCGLKLLVMVALVSAYMGFLLYSLKTESQQALEIIDFGHRMRLEELNTKNSLLESYYKLLLTKIGSNETYNTDFNSSMVNLLISSAESISSEQFAEFKAHSW
jgi:hypothetical protein